MRPQQKDWRCAVDRARLLRLTRSAVARALGQHVPRVAETYHAPWAEIMVALISPCIEEVRVSVVSRPLLHR
jgi:hypothetical protein